jgi:GTP-binding protein HflX
VIDASHPNWEEQRQVVDQVLAELGAAEKPVLYVFSKIDLLSLPDLDALRERIGNLLPGSAVFVSSATDAGLEPLRLALLAKVREDSQLAEIRMPAEDGKLLAEIYRSGGVLDRRSDNGQLLIRARLDEELANRLRRAGATVSYETG